MGFTLQEGVWVKFAANIVVDSRQLFEIESIDKVFKKKSIEERLESPDFNEFKISLERKLWPLKFKDVDISVYIIPIKPYWASQLFDYYAANNSLFGAEASLVWNRENIYYRNTKPVSEKHIGRILWYSSSTKDKSAIRTKSIIASSYLDEVHTGKAKELFKRFRHYGVYEWENIFDLAKQNTNTDIKALKFSDTEVFEKPVPFKDVNQVLMNHGRKKNTFTSPLEISNDIFLEIYNFGFYNIKG